MVVVDRFERGAAAPLSVCDWLVQVLRRALDGSAGPVSGTGSAAAAHVCWACLRTHPAIGTGALGPGTALCRSARDVVGGMFGLSRTDRHEVHVAVPERVESREQLVQRTPLLRNARRSLRVTARGFGAPVLRLPDLQGAQLAVGRQIPLQVWVIDRRVAGIGVGDAGLVVSARDGVVAAARRYLAAVDQTSLPVRHPADWDTIAPTARQMRIMALLARGMSEESVARRVGVSSRTVRADLTELSTTFGVRSRLELVHAYGAWLSAS